MNRTYSAVIPCICSHLPHHRIESRFDTIPDKSLDCKRFFHFCVIFCAPLHNYPKSTNNTRYKPAILLRGAGASIGGAQRRLTDRFFMRAAIAQKGANTSPAHRRRAAARGRCEKAGQDADGSRPEFAQGRSGAAFCHTRNFQPPRTRCVFAFTSGPAARSRTPPSALSAALPLQNAPVVTPAARRGRARQCVIKRIFNRSPVPVRPRLLFSRSAAVLSALPCAGAGPSYRWSGAISRGAGPLNICPRPSCAAPARLIYALPPCANARPA